MGSSDSLAALCQSGLQRPPASRALGTGDGARRQSKRACRITPQTAQTEVGGWASRRSERWFEPIGHGGQRAAEAVALKLPAGQGRQSAKPDAEKKPATAIGVYESASNGSEGEASHPRRRRHRPWRNRTVPPSQPHRAAKATLESSEAISQQLNWCRTWRTRHLVAPRSDWNEPGAQLSQLHPTQRHEGDDIVDHHEK